MRLHRLFLVVGLTAGFFPAAEGTDRPAAEAPSFVPAEPALQLPTMVVKSGRLADYPPIPKVDLNGGGLAPSEPPVNLFYPGSAYSDGVPKGFATVCVELDENGQALDFLLISYTEKYFGEALLRKARRATYSPLRFKGTAISSRFNFGYEFHPEYTVAMNSFNAIEHRALTIAGGRPKFKYQPVTEDELDNRLEPLRQAVPFFPEGYTPVGGKADSVLVTLFVDEQGHVRVPHVESASSPLLVRNALRAVHYWQFKPPTSKGKPALVYAAFALSFTRAGG